MSIATEIARIQQDKSKIRAKLIQLGLADTTDDLDALATAVNGIEDKGAVEATVKEGETYNIPKGYHNGAGTVTGTAGGGNYNLQAKEVEPTKAQQVVNSDEGYYGLSSVTVKAIPEIYQDVSMVTAEAGDVLSQKTFVTKEGITTVGTMPNNGPISQEIDGMTENLTVTIQEGYTDGGTVSLSGTIEAALAEI